MKDELAEGDEGVATPDPGGEERESRPEGVRLWWWLIVCWFTCVVLVVAVLERVLLEGRLVIDKQSNRY